GCLRRWLFTIGRKPTLRLRNDEERGGSLFGSIAAAVHAIRLSYRAPLVAALDDGAITFPFPILERWGGWRVRFSSRFPESVTRATPPQIYEIQVEGRQIAE